MLRFKHLISGLFFLILLIPTSQVFAQTSPTTPRQPRQPRAVKIADAPAVNVQESDVQATQVQNADAQVAETEASSGPNIGLFLRVGGGGDLSFYIHRSHGWNEDDNYGGWFVNVQVGYRPTEKLMVGIDQNFGGIYYLDSRGRDNKDFKFSGSTYITLAGLFGDSTGLGGEIGFGVGLMYDSTEEKDPTRRIFDSETSVMPAFKFMGALTYYLLPWLGIGVDLSYAIGLSVSTAALDRLQEISDPMTGYELEMMNGREYFNTLDLGVHIAFKL